MHTIPWSPEVLHEIYTSQFSLICCIYTCFRSWLNVKLSTYFLLFVKSLTWPAGDIKSRHLIISVESDVTYFGHLSFRLKYIRQNPFSLLFSSLFKKKSSVIIINLSSDTMILCGVMRRVLCKAQHFLLYKSQIPLLTAARIWTHFQTRKFSQTFSVFICL